MQIFEHNFIEGKEKDRRNTDVFQGLSTQRSVKFAENKQCPKSLIWLTMLYAELMRVISY